MSLDHWPLWRVDHDSKRLWFLCLFRPFLLPSEWVINLWTQPTLQVVILIRKDFVGLFPFLPFSPQTNRRPPIGSRPLHFSYSLTSTLVPQESPVPSFRSRSKTTNDERSNVLLSMGNLGLGVGLKTVVLQSKTFLPFPISFCMYIFLPLSCRLCPKYLSYFGRLHPLVGLRSRVFTNVSPQWISILTLLRPVVPNDNRPITILQEYYYVKTRRSSYSSTTRNLETGHFILSLQINQPGNRRNTTTLYSPSYKVYQVGGYFIMWNWFETCYRPSNVSLHQTWLSTLMSVHQKYGTRVH